MVAGVIDTGSRRTHEQLRGRVRFDSVLKGQYLDFNGHGSHVATIIAGRYAVDDVLSYQIGKKVECEGIAPEAEIYSIKALGYAIGTGSTSGIIEAIEKALDYGVDVINLSLGGECKYRSVEEDPMYYVFDEVLKERVIPVVAAGNSGPDANTIETPGWLPNVLAVGAVDPIKGVVADFSCLPGDTKVITEDGVTSLKELREGSSILSLHGDWTVKPSKVKKVWCTGEKEVFEIKVGARTIKATSNHPFLVCRRFKTSRYNVKAFEVKWKRVEELRKGDTIAITNKVKYGKPFKLPQIEHGYNKPWKQPIYTNEELMWLLGLWIGDGAYQIRDGKFGKKGRVTFWVPGLEKEVIKIIDNLFGIGNKCHIYEKYKRLEINSLAFARLIKNLGFSGKAHTKRVPQWVFSLPIEQRLAFIAGYLDADGYVRKNGVVVFTSVNYKLLEDIELLCSISGLHSMGIYSQYKDGYVTRLEDGTLIKLRKNSYVLVLNRYNVATIPTRVQKYKERLIEGNITLEGDVVFLPIKKIEKIGKEKVYDITVNPVGNFIANGFIVHNSRGPTNDKRVKPDCVGYGVNIHCLSSGTRLLTPTGYKQITAIKRGDEIITYNVKTGKFELDRVLYVGKRKKRIGEKVFRIFTDEGHVIEASEEHKFLVCRDGKTMWIEAEKLRVGDRLYADPNCSHKDRVSVNYKISQRIKSLNLKGELNPNWRGGKYVPCATCGKLVWTPPSWRTKTGLRFCSKVCYDKWQRGKTWEERLEKAKAMKLRQQLSNRMQGENNPFYKKKHSKESIRKMIETKITKGQIKPYKKIRCLNCGKEMIVKGSSKRKVCSPKCQYEYLKKSGFYQRIQELARKVLKEKYGENYLKVLSQKGLRKLAKLGKIGGTTPEKAVETVLKILELDYVKQAIIPLRDGKFTVADFVLLHDKIAIYVDGEYWHSSPEVKQRDEEIDKNLEELGWKVFRIPEVEARKAKVVINKLSELVPVDPVIVKIEEVNCNLLYDVTAEKNHTLIANGIIVHNSGLAGQLDYVGDNEPNRYSALSGTSMATPTVAGMLLLMRQAFRELIGRELELEDVIDMLRTTSYEKTNDYGWGLVTWQRFKEWLEIKFGVV